MQVPGTIKDIYCDGVKCCHRIHEIAESERTIRMMQQLVMPTGVCHIHGGSLGMM